MSSVDIPRTFGALLTGGLFASLLSGTVAVQVIIYFRLYPHDTPRLKGLVLFVWTLDILHTLCIWTALWNYLIDHFGDSSRIDFIPWNISLTVVFTGILTFLVHCFFAQRIFMLSKRNYLLTVPVVILSVLRLACASVTTGEMLHTRSFHDFISHFRWVFTLGLALSTLVDVLITGSVLYLLHSSRSTVAADLNALIDNLTCYAFETGALTSAGTVVTMILWLAMSSNLIFMGLHFVIGKFYANSFLVTLNARRTQRRRSSVSVSRDHGAPVPILEARRRTSSDQYNPPLRSGFMTKMSSPQITASSDQSSFKQLEINVQQSVLYDTK